MESNLCYRSKETCEDLKLFDKLPSVKPQEPCDVSDTNIGKMSENPTGSEKVGDKE